MKNFVNTNSIFVVTENGEKTEVNVSVATHLYGERVIEDVYLAILANPAILEEKAPVALLLGNTVAVLQCRRDAVAVRRVFSAIKHGIKELANIADSLWEASDEGVEYVCSL